MYHKTGLPVYRNFYSGSLLKAYAKKLKVLSNTQYNHNNKKHFIFTILFRFFERYVLSVIFETFLFACIVNYIRTMIFILPLLYILLCCFPWSIILDLQSDRKALFNNSAEKVFPSEDATQCGTTTNSSVVPNNNIYSENTPSKPKNDQYSTKKIFSGCPYFFSTDSMNFNTFLIFRPRSLAWKFFSTSWNGRAFRIYLLWAFIFSFLISLITFIHTQFLYPYLPMIYNRSFQQDLDNLTKMSNVLLIGFIWSNITKLICIMIWLSRSALAQPNLTEENRLPMRSDLISCYSSEEEACTYSRKRSSNIFTLFSIDNTSLKKKLNKVEFYPYYNEDIPTLVGSTNETIVNEDILCFLCTYETRLPDNVHSSEYCMDIVNNPQTLKSGQYFKIDYPQHSELVHIVSWPNDNDRNELLSNQNSFFLHYLNKIINPLYYTAVLNPFYSPPYIRGLKIQNSKQTVPWTCYRFYFDIPWSFPMDNEGEPLYKNIPTVSIIINGCGPAFYLFLNSHYIGYSTDTFLKAEFDITKQLVYSNSKNIINEKYPPEFKSLYYSKYKNNLVILVRKICCQSYLEKQDQWTLTGCFRSIEIICKPNLHLLAQSCNLTSMHNLTDNDTDNLCNSIQQDENTFKSDQVIEMQIQNNSNCTQPSPNKPSLCVFIEDMIVNGIIDPSSINTSNINGNISVILRLSCYFLKNIKHYVPLSEMLSSVSSNNKAITSLIESYFVSFKIYTLTPSLLIELYKKEKNPVHLDFLAKPFSAYEKSFVDINFIQYLLSNMPKALTLICEVTSPLTFFGGYMETSDSFTKAFHIPVNNISLWSNETPELYMLTITLKKKTIPTNIENSITIQSESCLVGFRSIEIQKSNLLFNAKPFLFKGVNRHEHHPFFGKSVPLETTILDLLLIKQYNFNSIRCSHYSCTPIFYTLCDILGLLVVNEANLESHGDILKSPKSLLARLTYRLPVIPISRLCNDYDWVVSFLERIQRMVIEFRNHPCIVCWSLGNESGIGTSHIYAKYWIQKIENNVIRDGLGRGRIIQYDSTTYDSSVSDTFSVMYLPCDYIERYKKKIIASRKMELKCNSKPLLPLLYIEFEHAMGNSSGQTMDYWNAFDKNVGTIGGFIWDWVDQGLILSYKDKNSLVNYWSYGGDFNELLHDLNYCINGLVYPNRQIKPGLIETKYALQPIQISLISSDENIANNSSNRNTVYKKYLTVDVPEHALFSSSELLLLIIKVTNCNNFQSLDGHKLTYELYDYDKSIYWLQRGTVSLDDILPDEAHIITFKIDTGCLVEKNMVNKLNIIMYIQFENDLIWANTDYILCREQFIIDLNNNKSQSIECYPYPKLYNPIEMISEINDHLLKMISSSMNIWDDIPRMNANNLKLFDENKRIVVEFCSKTGNFISFNQMNTFDNGNSIPIPIIQGPLEFNFYRSPTDNDRGGIKVNEVLGNIVKVGILSSIKCGIKALKYQINDHVSFSSLWDYIGLNSMESIYVNHNSCIITPQNEPLYKSGILLRVKMIQNHYAKIKCPCNCSKCCLNNICNKKLLFKSNTTFDFFDTYMRINTSVEATKFWKLNKYKDKLPRIGFKLKIPNIFENLIYFGLGPHENYSDRMGSSIKMIHQIPVNDLFEPYIFPSEYGTRGSTEWLILDSTQTPGLCCKTDDLETQAENFSFSVHHFSINQLTNASHTSDLSLSLDGRGYYLFGENEKPSTTINPDSINKLNSIKYLYLYIDFFHTGVGGEASWLPCIKPKYRLKPQIKDHTEYFIFNKSIVLSRIDHNQIEKSINTNLSYQSL